MQRDKYVGTSELNNILRSEIAELLAENNSAEVADFDLPKTGNPYVILVVGVNGVGKTTFAREFLPNESGCPVFINADLIAAGLSPFQPELVSIKAGRIMLEEIYEYSSQGTSFVKE